MKNINYEKAHKIVDKNKNLMWVGWDIIEYKYDDEAIYSKNAMRINGKWAKINRYSPGSNGWKVPDRYDI